MASMPRRPVACAGVVSDLDGTLLDTEDVYWRAYKGAVESFGKTYDFEVHKNIMGVPEVPGAKYVVETVGIDGVTPEAFLARRDEHLVPLMPTVAPCAGALQLVKAIKAARLPLAVATSSYRSYLELKQRNNGALFENFDHIVCGDDDGVKGHGKPAPDIFLAGAAGLTVDPAQCIAFEDSVAGVTAAKAAGMFCVAVPDSRLDKSRFAAADLIVDSLADLDFASLLAPSADLVAGAPVTATGAGCDSGGDGGGDAAPSDSAVS